MPFDPIALAKLLRDGGLIGALALSLVIIGFLFRELSKSKAEHMAALVDAAAALAAEKDAHRATAVDIIPIARDMARLVEALNTPSRRARNVRATGPSGGGSPRGPNPTGETAVSSSATNAPGIPDKARSG